MAATTKRKRLSAEARRVVIEEAASAVFARRGYAGASMDEIARRSGVTVPVVYDHFPSKAALYERLIDRHYAELRSVWFRHADDGLPLGEWLAAAVDDWFAHVEAHPFAGRMLFHDTTGDPQLARMHKRIQRRSRDALLPLVAEAGGIDGEVDVELAWETLRAVLQGLAVWWLDHPSVPRERIVAATMGAVWLGLERVLEGERWEA